MKPFSPSRSILPAQTRHCIGRNSGDPNTSPRQITNTATAVSIDISIGSEVTVDAAVECDAMDDKDAVLVEWRAECSWAE
jgi:hypothetical protein